MFPAYLYGCGFVTLILAHREGVDEEIEDVCNDNFIFEVD